MKIVALFLLSVSLALSAGTPGLSVTETPVTIDAATPAYRLTVQRSPYALSLLRGDRTILAHRSPRDQAGPASFVLNGVGYSLQAVKSWSAQGSTLFIRVTTAPAGPDVAVSFVCLPDHVDVNWSAGGQPLERAREEFSLQAGGHWYGGNVTSAHDWPLETGDIQLDPFLATSNQATPVWLTSSGAGIFVRTYQPMGFSLNHNRDGLFSLNLKNTSAMQYQLLVGVNIVEVFRAFVALAGKPAVVPPKEYFAEPVFNSWIQFLTKVTQSDVIGYANRIRQSGIPSTVLMLDDGWATRYGDHTFNPTKFPDPRKMVDQVHKLGFQLALWVVPFIEKDAANYSEAARKRFLVTDKTGRTPAIVKWWNGEAAMVDLSNPEAYRWFLDQLLALQRDLGVDGFKLDAGDAEYFSPDFVTFGGVTPNQYTDLFAGLGRNFAINELRVSWLAQTFGLVERLRDKNSNWNPKTGLGSLIPDGLTESLIGYPYFCPDIIGGGEGGDFGPDAKGIAPELFVRWTEASALMPMMQFSYAPWRLDEKHAAIVKRYAELHGKLGGYIYRLALEARETGMPIARPLFFRNPEDENTYLIKDEFLLGDRLLVAPVLERGVLARDVYLPAGLWKDFWSGEIYEGGKKLTRYPAPLDTLPVFVSLM